MEGHAVGRHRAAARGRTLHLLDIESLVGAMATHESCADAWRRYRAAVRVESDDQVVAIGADRGLLAPWTVHEVTRQFDRVVIGSGDRIFAGYARALHSAGVRVEQATGPRASDAYVAAERRYELLPAA